MRKNFYLKSAYVFNDKCLVNGRWLESSDDQNVKVVNPFDNSLLAIIPSLTSCQITLAINSAENAQLSWQNTTVYSRREIMHSWKDLILKNMDDIASILVCEQGKPYREAVDEINFGLSCLDFYADEALRIYDEIIPSPFHAAEITIIREPVGVVGIIIPWNFPAAMLLRKIAPCLAAGCTCVVKPDERTPLTSFSLMKLAVDAGFPPGVINCITGDPILIGSIFSASDKVRKISFTGSVSVGKQLIQGSAQNVKRLTLELGGNAPFLIFEDADIQNSVSELVAAKFRNSGQTCISPNRVYVHSSICDIFITALLRSMSDLKMDDGFKPDVSIGPMIDEKALKRLEDYVSASSDRGAVILYGGKRWIENKNFFIPTILINVTDDMPVMKNEVFGPILSVSKFNYEEEALERANNTSYGLACYLFTSDIKRIGRLKNELEFGMIGVNTSKISSPFIPFGGVKESGFGREGGRHGIDEYLSLKYICLKM